MDKKEGTVVVGIKGGQDDHLGLGRCRYMAGKREDVGHAPRVKACFKSTYRLDRKGIGVDIKSG